MDENLQDIEDLFRNALEENQEKPSREVWDNLEKNLEHDHLENLKGKYNTLKKLSVVLLILLGISLYELFTRNSSHRPGTEARGDSVIGRMSAPTPLSGNAKQGSGVLSLIAENQSDSSLITSSGQPANTKEQHHFSANDSKFPDSISQKATNSPDRTVQQKPLRRATAQFASGTDATHGNLTAIPAGKINLRQSSGITPFNRLDARQRDSRTVITKKRAIPFMEDSAQMMLSKQQVLTALLQPGNQFHPLPGGSLPQLQGTSKNGNLPTTGNTPNSLYLTPFFSPDFAWYRLQNDNVGNQADSAGVLERNERHEFSYTFGILVDKFLNKHFAIESGLSLSNTNLTLEPKFLYAQPDNSGIVKYRINTSSGYGYVLPSFSQSPSLGDSIFMYSSVHSLQYASIPISAVYSVQLNNFSFSLTGGISLNFLTRAKLEVSLENLSSKSTETINNLVGIRKMYFSGLAGAGIAYRLNNQMSLSILPTFRFALNSIDQHATVKSYPMTFGSVAGLKIGF